MELSMIIRGDNHEATRLRSQGLPTKRTRMMYADASATKLHEKWVRGCLVEAARSMRWRPTTIPAVAKSTRQLFRAHAMVRLPTTVFPFFLLKYL